MGDAVSTSVPLHVLFTSAQIGACLGSSLGDLDMVAFAFLKPWPRNSQPSGW